MGQYLGAVKGHAAPRLLVVYEPATSRAAAAIAPERGAKRFLRYLDYLAWRRFERRLLDQVDAVTVFTAHDRDELRRLDATLPISVIPFGVDVPAQPLNPGGSGDDVVLFIGNFGHRPNVDAALRLARLFPRIRERHPEATLELVGPQPPAELRAVAGDGIVVVGPVPNLTPPLDRANVFVAPLVSGGGMRLKVVEALAAGKAIVASRLAAEGLTITDRKELLLADGDDETVEAISLLLGDPQLRRAVAERGRLFALEQLDWPKTIASYVRLHATLLSAPTSERDHRGIADEPTEAEPSAAAPAVPAAAEDVEERG
jgi:polysaccharide biosynthesis protein PslH